MQRIAEIFRPEGVLASHLEGYSHRDAQERMAELVEQAIDSSGHAAIEAGTGIGKTFAYLIPVLLSGRRTIVSTGTKTLQDQLYTKDLPALAAAIGAPARLAVLKGRANYLCRHRLELARTDRAMARELKHVLEALGQWARTSVDGDLGSVQDLEEDPILRARVSSTVENCLGTQCEHYEGCFVVEARRRAQAAKVVIVNHHLLLADLALKEAGFGELLGDAETVIVDEAHLLPDIAQQFFGIAATSREMGRLVDDTVGELRLAGLASESVDVGRGLIGALGRLSASGAGLAGRLPWPSLAARLLERARDCLAELGALAGVLREAEDASPGILRCRERCDDLAARLGSVLDSSDEDGLRWVEAKGRSLAFHYTPLDTGERLAERIEAQSGQWILTSATLAVAGRFDHFLDRVGLDVGLTAVLPSPFDYAHNARLYLPQGLPLPRDEDFVDSLMRHVWPLVEAAGGGAFLLFTSHRALERAERWVGSRTAPGLVLAQGSGPRSELLERFREARNAVLLGTGSFWQGVDVRGDALRLVVIDKLPFAAPGDPLVEARIRAIERRGGDAFMEYQLPQAVLTLKQGVGRLIRDYDDSGLIVLGDPRLRTKHYGRVFLESLPPAPIVEDFDAALDFAERLRPGSDMLAAEGS